MWSIIASILSLQLYYINAANVITEVGRIYLPDFVDGMKMDGVESIAIDYVNDLIFTANGNLSTVDVVSFDVSNIDNGEVPMTYLQSINIATPVLEYDGTIIADITAVKYNHALEKVLAAVAPQAVAEDEGHLVVIDPITKEVETVIGLTDCFLPDHLTKTSDGNTVILVCEGEPDNNEIQYPMINPPGSIAIVTLDDQQVYNLNFEAWNEGGTKTLPDNIYMPYQNESFSVNVEPEYVVVDTSDEYAYITLQEANGIAVVDIAGREIIGIYSLGLIDYSKTGLDASDKDGKINIQTYPNLWGFRQPDVIDYIKTADDREYVLTANEGENKDFDESKVGKIGLDSTAFSGYDLNALQSDEQLGRLRVVNQLGFSDNATHDTFSTLYAFGGRDITAFEIIKNANGVVTNLKFAYSSLDDFEQITADILGTQGFNANLFNPSFDERSDNKGPEPETVIFGFCDDILYGFAGLEKTGGIMVYDMTDMDDVEFKQYLNSRNYDVTYDEDTLPPSDAGDIAPEQLRYVPAEEYGVPLLMAAYTESSSIAIYTVSCDTDIETTSLDGANRFTVFTSFAIILYLCLVN